MTYDDILRIVKSLLFIIAGSCIWMGMDSMKKGRKKNYFFIAAFLLIVLGYYVYTRIAGTG